MNRIARRLGHGVCVLYKHIHWLNASVEGSGFCSICRRIKNSALIQCWLGDKDQPNYYTNKGNCVLV